MKVTPEQKLDPAQRTAFGFALRAAKNVLKRRVRVLYLARDAYDKLGGEGSAMSRAQGDLRILLRLATAWAGREYRSVPWKSLLYAVAAIVYFVSPLDLIPDFFAGIGFVDDIAVVTAVVSSLRADLEDFLAWERHRLPSGGAR